MNASTQLSVAELSSAELVVEGRLVDASNATLFCELKLEDGATGVRKVVYKPIAGERPLWDFPDGNLAGREVAAYLVSNLGGFNLVPTTVMREGPFGPGAVQEWIHVDPELDVIAFAQSADPRLRVMALFDYIINNTDRKFGHVLITHEGILFGCDHGVSFHKEFKLRTVIWQFAGLEINADELALIERLLSRFEELELGLSPYINSEEIAALKVRLESLKKEPHFPFPNPNWPAIPWPPV
ncbi:MAG: SCO1664 family protein [Candidatus Nanopelagicaceae bacterium]|nr:SCO1664 family protein [Candidatus Nanopelagicaceae bacterium]